MKKIDALQTTMALKPKILISACLLGQPVRYDGQSKPIFNKYIDHWQQNKQLVVICPEVAGGLSTPRPAAEVISRQPLFVSTTEGQDVTAEFVSGAQQALKLCLKHDIDYAVLKERSPSCGTTQNYDGSFSKQLIPEMGVTAQLLTTHGIKVYTEESIQELYLELQTL
jgi:uncharacterized protein YbbK (DUF523 family)